LSLGLGIGVNTTLFSIFNAVFLHQVSASDPAHLWRVWFGGANKISYPGYRDLLESRILPDLAASTGDQLNLTTGDDIERVSGEILTADFFRVLGIGAASGRTFTTEQDVVVLSDGCWRRRFGRDPHILGRVLNLNARPYTVIGVLPRGYRSVEGFGLAPEFYLPISRFTLSYLNERGYRTLDLFCRLPQGMSPQQAVSVLTTQSKEQQRLYPELNETMNRSTIRLYPLSGLEGFQGTGAPMEMLIFVGILFVVVGLVLLIACANVASLLLARGASRSREIAIRLALGATRWRLVRTLLAESLLLSSLSSSFALLLSLWLTALVSVVSIPGFPMPIELQLNPDFRVLLYAVAAALVTALLCGLAPAWQSVEHALACSMRQERTIVHRRFTLRNALVVGQVAVSLTLLITSFLFLRSLMRIGSVDPGFNVDHLLTAKVRLDRSRYTEGQQS
jgi:putative ABC transport system permease protein